MNYTLPELLGIPKAEYETNPLTIKQCLDRYLFLLKHYTFELINDLTVFNAQERLYIFPDSHMELAESVKKMIITGFLIIHEITNSPIVLIQLDDLLKNNRLCTPDVLFYIVPLLNNLLVKMNNHDYDETFSEINERLSVIGTLDNRFFDVNLFNIKMINISLKCLRNDFPYDSKESTSLAMQAFREELFNSVAKNSDDQTEEKSSEFTSTNNVNDETK